MSKTKKSMLLPIVLALSFASVIITGAQVADYPNRPIQVIVPFAGGSASDVVTRVLLQEMSKSLGQNFIVENRPGAGGNSGTATAAKAPPNGYTLVMSTSGPLAANKTFVQNTRLRAREGFRADLTLRHSAECHCDQFQTPTENTHGVHRVC